MPLVLAAGAAGILLSRSDTSVEPAPNKQRGVCWVGQPQPTTELDIKDAKNCGIGWISQTPFGWQRSTADTLIRSETSAETPWWGESRKGIAMTAELAHDHGIKTLLKPHLWVRESWPGDIEMDSEGAWLAWFRNYENFIMDYARLADSTGIEILCIGTELHKTVERPEWRSLIKKIRSVYKGELTYAANFNEEFEVVPFWNDLDYIGIQGYFPLSTASKPDLEDLRQGWRDPIRRLEKVHQKFRKPVLFTELGYKSTPDAATMPWRWPERDEEISLETQSNCYEAFFQTAWSLDWIVGVYFWKWYPHPPRHPTESDFTPQGKPAEKVMKTWFVKNNVNYDP